MLLQMSVSIESGKFGKDWIVLYEQRIFLMFCGNTGRTVRKVQSQINVCKLGGRGGNDVIKFCEQSRYCKVNGSVDNVVKPFVLQSK
jgi:hypothetical protein